MRTISKKESPAVNLKKPKQIISSEIHFYTIESLAEMLGWSIGTAQKMFNSPDFVERCTIFGAPFKSKNHRYRMTPVAPFYASDNIEMIICIHCPA